MLVADGDQASVFGSRGGHSVHRLDPNIPGGRAPWPQGSRSCATLVLFCCEQEMEKGERPTGSGKTELLVFSAISVNSVAGVWRGGLGRSG